MLKRSILVVAGLVLCGIAVVGFLTTRPVVAQGSPPQPPPGPRWQVFHAEISLSEKPEDVARNTILLDTTTGKSWVFWTTPDKDRPYQWVQIKRDDQ